MKNSLNFHDFPEERETSVIVGSTWKWKLTPSGGDVFWGLPKLILPQASPDCAGVDKDLVVGAKRSYCQAMSILTAVEAKKDARRRYIRFWFPYKILTFYIVSIIN